MQLAIWLGRTAAVALLAEGVDRNLGGNYYGLQNKLSPSSRRAWIEIPQVKNRKKIAESPSSRRAWIEIFWSSKRRQRPSVALLAEGVDRNSKW